ncbi:MAG: hypothetical protein ACWGQW_00090 [bacterium]
METIRSDDSRLARCVQSIEQTDVTPYKGFIRRASLDDVIRVSSDLRDEDWNEVRAQTGLPAQLVLPYAHEQGRLIFACGMASEGTAELLWGWDEIPGSPEVAVIWMLSTPAINKHAASFAPVSKVMVQTVNDHYRYLTNYIDARNVRHIGWLKWLGFVQLRRIDRFGPESRPFFEYVRYR